MTKKKNEAQPKKSNHATANARSRQARVLVCCKFQMDKRKGRAVEDAKGVGMGKVDGPHAKKISTMRAGIVASECEADHRVATTKTDRSYRCSGGRMV